MVEKTGKIKGMIEQLSQINGEEKLELLAEVKSLEKTLAKNEFKLSRILKDKRIAIDVLNSTIL